MSLLDPPDFMDEAQRRSWNVVARKVDAQGNLDTLSRPALELATMSFHSYVSAVAACGDGPLNAEAEQWRCVARGLAADFFLLADTRRAIGVAGPGRIDADLAALYDWTPEDS